MIGAVLGQAAATCPRTTPDCVSTLTRKPLFEGFGLHEVLVVGGAVAATLVGLIVVAWLLVVLTGANRDYELARTQAAAPTVKVLGAEGATPELPGTPTVAARVPTTALIRPSTWVATAVVFAAVIATATWIAIGATPESAVEGPPVATTRVPGPTTPVTTVVTCPSAALAASYLPTGYATALVPGFGGTAAVVPGCYYHWQGPGTAVITVLLTGDSPYGPRGDAQSRTTRSGKVLWAGTTPQGAAGVVVEEREIGGAPDIWYTLVSSSVSQDELLSVAAGLSLVKA